MKNYKLKRKGRNKVKVKISLELPLFFKYLKSRKNVLNRGENKQKFLYKIIKSMEYKVREKSINKEFLESSMILKNLAITYEDMPLSCDYILEELFLNSKYLKEIYSEMLFAYRNGNDEFYKILSNKINTKDSKNFSMILGKIDSINPWQLVGYMESFENAQREQRITEAMNKDNLKSIFVTFATTIPAFAVMLNFTIVVVFMGAIEMLNSIF